MGVGDLFREGRLMGWLMIAALILGIAARWRHRERIRKQHGRAPQDSWFV